MIAAALEASSDRPTVALQLEARIHETALDGGRAHACDLLPRLAELLETHAIAPAELTHLFVGTGPGSFTGLRVAIATALGLARSSGARVIGIPSSEALAWSNLAPGDEGVLALDARRGELYFAHYARTATRVEVRVAPRIVRAEDVAIPPGAHVFVDRATATWIDVDDGPARVVVDARPSARALIELGRARPDDASHELEPLYLRSFAARPRKR